MYACVVCTVYAFFCPYQLPVTLPVTTVPVSVPTLAAVLLGIQDQHAAYLVSSECGISLQSITSIVNLHMYSEQIHAYSNTICILLSLHVEA